MAGRAHFTESAWALLVLFTAHTAGAQQGNCSSALGMESGDIANSQISCWSSAYCTNARPNRRGWTNYQSSPVAYSQVDLLQVKNVTRVSLSSARSHYTKSFRIYYSVDGSVWQTYQPQSNSSFLGQILPGNSEATPTVVRYLNPPIQARYIALNPVAWNGYASLKYELYGCDFDSRAQSTGQNITQDIQDDRVFVTSLSPYIIDRPIHIRPGASLTIQAGVRVLFTNTNAKLVVYGRLKSDGLQGLRVVFSHNSNPLGNSLGRWDGVEVRKGADVALTNTDIWQAERGLRGNAENMALSSCGVYVSSTGLVLTSGRENKTNQPFTGGIVYGCEHGIELSSGQEISHFLFQSYNIVNSQQYGINVKSGNCGLGIENSQVSYSGRTGISTSKSSPLAYLRMDKVIVRNNGRYGVYLYVDTLVDIRYSSFIANRYKGMYVLGHTQANAVFLNNSFENNRQSGLYLTQNKVTFTGNALTKNRDGYAIVVDSYHGTDTSTCVITENVLHDNYGGMNITTSSNVTFLHNVIAGSHSSYAVYVDAEWVSFSYNKVVNTTNSAAVLVNKMPQYPLSMNTFINPECDYEIDTTVPFRDGYSINAAYNYWESSNASFIQSRVKDAFVNIDLVLITMSPFFVTREMTELYTGPDPDEFTQDDFAIGGRLVHDVILPRNTSFTVTRSIYVPQGISLVIEPGVELRFLQTRGIFARGNLSLTGEDHAIITLTSANEKEWSGIRLDRTEFLASHAIVEKVGTACFTLTNTSRVTMFSVIMTDGGYGVKTVLGVPSKLHFRDVHVSKMAETGLSLNIEDGASVDWNIDESTVSECRDGYWLESQNSGREEGSLQLVMTKSVFRENKNYAIHMKQSIVFPISVLISDSLIEGSSQHTFGLFINLTYANFSVINSTFKSLAHPMNLIFNGRCQTVSIEHNRIENAFSQRHIDLYKSGPGNGENCTLDIVDNVVRQDNADTSQIGGIRIKAYYGTKTINVERNRLLGINNPAIYLFFQHTSLVSVSENVITDCQKAMYVEATEGSATVRIYQNEILRNFGTEIITLGTAALWSSPLEFERNTMRNNSNTVILLERSNALIHYNVFSNPDAAINLRLSESQAGDGDVNATLNYWGSVDSREIAGKMYDQKSDPNLPLILFQPYFDNSSLSSVYQETLMFVTPDGTIGGEVNGNVTLSVEGSPYTAVGSINIRNGDVLRVEAGVEINFLPNTGVIVDGTLIVEGNADNPVNFLPQSTGRKWRGIKFQQTDYFHDPDIRLVAGNQPNEGRVEIRYNGEFGTICDDDFGEEDALVVCRMLGYGPQGGATVKPRAAYGKGIGVIWLDNMKCRGDEPSVSFCGSRGWGIHNCHHVEDVGVICHGNRLKEANSGVPKSQLDYLLVNDTTDGIQIRETPPRMNAVSVAFSSADGFLFQYPTIREDTSINALLAAFNSKSGIHVDFGHQAHFPYLNISTAFLRNNTNTGIRVKNNGNLEVNSCEVYGSKTAISLESNLAGSLIFRSCDFHDNSERVVLSSRRSSTGGNFSFILADSSIHDHSYYSGWSLKYRSLIDISVNDQLKQVTWIFKNNTFFDVDISGTILELNAQYARSALLNIDISGNIFMNISRGKAIEMRASSRSAIIVTIGNNFFQNITDSTGNALIEIRQENDVSSIVRVENNTFIDNEVRSVLYLSGEVGVYPHTYVTLNKFLNNSARNIVLSAVSGFRVRNNIFTNPRASCEIRGSAFNDLTAINAKHCYWGFGELDKILQRVCSFEKDMGLSRVDFIPYLLSTDLDDILDIPDGTFYLESLIGGVLMGRLTLAKGAKPVVISRPVYVEKNATLVIEAGSTVEFEENCGIFVKGQVVIGSDKGNRTTLQPHNSDFWEGIVFGSRSTSNPVPEMKNTDILNPRTGVRFLTSRVTVFNNVISGSRNAGITLEVRNTAFDFNGTSVENSGSHGVYSDLAVDITVKNLTIVGSNSHGVNFRSTGGHIVIEYITLDSNGGAGVEITYDRNGPCSLTISHSHVLNSQDVAVRARLRFFYRVFSLNIDSNSFTNNTAGGFLVSSNYYDSYTDKELPTCNITNNVFTNNGASSLAGYSYAAVNIKNNRFLNSRSLDKCTLSLKSFALRNEKPSKVISVSTNRFEMGSGKCAVSLSSQDEENLEGLFIYNQMFSFEATEATILVDSIHFNVTDNILDNPRSVYEVKVAKAGTGVVSAVRNWWGSANLLSATSRVFDRTQDPTLLAVEIQPIRQELTFDCSLAGNCSGQGECVRPNGCRCYRGWTGPRCTEYDCSGVSQCSGRGSCIGPNICQCNPGYSGSRCELATCSNVNDCSGNGFCIAPDTCQCFTEYSGSTCSECGPDRWGEDCLPCPFCVKPQGICNTQNGTCLCASNWAGDICDRCAETFYGPNCEPLVTVLNVFPDGGPDTGGTEVHVRGHNFPETTNNTFYCRFGSVIVEGIRLSREHVVCMTPKLPKDTYSVEISADGTMDFTNNKVLFNVYAQCPPNACGKSFSPAHGYCAFGSCVCELPWSGSNCLTEILAPRIAVIAPIISVREGDTFSLKLNLTEGTSPVAWFIQGQPEGMFLDVRSATVTWDRTIGSGTPYRVVIGARNIVGTEKKTLELRVPLSYNVTIEATTPSGTLPTPEPVTISGHVNFWNTDGPRAVRVDLLIRQSNITRTVTTFSSPDGNGYFEAVFYHQFQDSGEFVASGNHPSDQIFRPQKSWKVQGLRCSNPSLRLVSYLDEEQVTFSSATQLINTGVEVVRNIRTEVFGVGSPLEAVSVIPTGTSDANSPYFTTSLEPSSGIAFDVILTASGPLRGTIAVTFTADEGTTTTCGISIDLSIRKPHFTISPRAIRANLLIGSRATYEITVTNDGEAESTNVRVDLPNDERFSLVSFSKPLSPSTADGVPPDVLSLSKDESAILSIRITSAKSDNLGEMRGQIAVYSDQISSAVPYHIILVSDTRFNLTIRVEDEFTYFDKNHPLVSNATVTLVNGRRNFRTTLMTTDDKGWVTFENLQEDKYDLRVQSPGHGAYVAVIVADSTSPHMSVFLQRTAITYTFSVTPASFEDKYVISLETTFETQVPMPVVTVEPTQVNTIPYEEGRKDILEFRLTNHGLIRADNVRFALPSHPRLLFFMTNDEIGHLDANSSIIVPVRVQRRTSETATALSTVSVKTISPSTVHSGSTTGRPDVPATRTPSTGTPTNLSDPLSSSGGSRVRRSASGGGSSGSCGSTIRVVYDYVCGSRRSRTITVSLYDERPGRPPVLCAGVAAVGGGEYFGGLGAVVVYSTITPVSCDCLKSYVQNCIPFGSCAVSAAERSLTGILKDCALPILPISGCAKAIIGAAFPQSSFPDRAISIVDIAMSCVVSSLCPICGPIWNLIKCLVKVIPTCNSGARKRRDVSSAIVENLVMKSPPVDNFLDLSVGILGSRDLLELTDNGWYSKFKSAITDESPSGNYLTTGEYNNVWTGLNDTKSQEAVRNFLRRWNNTVSAFKDGTLASRPDTENVIPFRSTQEKYEQYVQDSSNAKKSGFDTIFDEFDNAIGVYIDAKKQESGPDKGVCAKVRVRIVQDLVLTRDAFNARLEIENGEQSPLTNIKVILKITPATDPSRNATDKFAIGDPELVGITSVDGRGSLAQAKSGTADWLIIPYSTAAIREDTEYDVGGSFSYSVGSSSLTVSLVPDTITVKPNPNLEVHYFHDKYVQGNDPFTDAVEPSVPFVLAVMITNTGYGVAKSVKITSAEPEIIENEKGLLVNFKIVGTALNGKPIPFSLTVDFGDIDPFQTKVARWYLTSSLKGLFYNYSATFENINPLGDPQLSVLDVLKSHELIHTVRKDVPDDDKLDDFLVNDELDAGDLADHVFDSSTGLKDGLVNSALVQFQESVGSDGQYTSVDLTCNVSDVGWFYLRVETDLASSEDSRRKLLAVTREDGREILLRKNTWTTDHYKDAPFFHLFDYSDNNVTVFHYTVIFGPENNFEPEFDNKEYNVRAKFPLSANSFVTRVHANDEDGHPVRYSLKMPAGQFSINNQTGEIRSLVLISEPQTLVLTVTATDSGVPSKNASVTVTISPDDGSQPTTSSNTSSTSRSAKTTRTSSIKTITQAPTTSNVKRTQTTSDQWANTTIIVTTDVFSNVTGVNETVSSAVRKQVAAAYYFVPACIILVVAHVIEN